MNYYNELEVTPTASTAVIKAAYKAQVKHYHPDVFKGDKLFATNKLKTLNEAYEVLCNPSKRLEYDKLFNFTNQQKNTNPKETKQQKTANNTMNNSRSNANYTKTKKTNQKKHDSNNNYHHEVSIAFLVLLIFISIILITMSYTYK